MSRFAFVATLATFALASGFLTAPLAANAASTVAVNKAFSPNVVNLGQTSLVTISFANTSTTSASTISAFSDDIATMSGFAAIAPVPNLTTTCAGGTPTISGSVVSMTNGTIPIAPSTSVPGKCTVSFNVVGSKVGNGFNTILASNVVTSLGAPSGDVTQTLDILPVNVTIASGATQSTLIGASGTVSFTLTNSTSVALTNVGFPVTASALGIFSVLAATTTCGGGPGPLPATGTSATVQFSGLKIPANSSCTVTLTSTSAVATTVTFAIGATTIVDDQGTTNSSAASTQDKFTNGKPTLAKSFSPSTVVPGATTTLVISVPNGLTTQALDAASYTDVLPAGLTIVSLAANASCGSPTLTGIGTGTVGFAAGTIAANSTCTVTATVSVSSTQPIGTVTNTIPSTSFASVEVVGAANNASATLTTTAASGGVTIAKSFAPTSAGPNTPILVTLKFTSVGSALTGGTFTDTLPKTPVSMLAFSDATHQPTFANCGASPTVTFGSGNATVNGSNLAVALGATCSVTFSVVFPSPVATSQTDTNVLATTDVSFTAGPSPVSPTVAASATARENPAISLSNFVSSVQTLANQTATMKAEITDSSGSSDSAATATFVLDPAGTHNIALAANPNFTFSAGCPPGLSAANITIGTARESFSVALASINATCDITYGVVDEGGLTGTFAPANSTYASTLTGGATLTFGATNTVTFATTGFNLTKAFSPNQIQSGGISTVTITISVAPVAGFGTTPAYGIGVSDALPTNIVFAPTPSVAFGPGCQLTGQPAPSFAIAGTTIAFSNISTQTVGMTPTACNVTFNVTSSTIGAPLNTIPAGAITSTSGGTNAGAAQASLTVSAGIALQKAFVNGSMAFGASDYVRFLLTNSASLTPLTGGTLVDNMPASLALASTTLGPSRSGDPVLCGGAIGSGTVGASSFTLTGLTIPAAVGATPGQCAVYVLVTTTSAATLGSVTNTIAVGQLSFSGFANQTAASGVETLVNSTVSMQKVGPTQIGAGETVQYRITIANASGGSAVANGLNFVDPVPSGIALVSATCVASTGVTCSAPSISGQTVRATIDGLAAGGLATISIVGRNGALPLGTTTNTAGVSSSQIPTINAASSVVVVANSATKTVANITQSSAAGATGVAVPGDTLEYTISYTNGTNAGLAGFAFTDVVPANTTYVAGSAACVTTPAALSCTASGPVASVLTWTYGGGSVMPGDVLTVKFRVTVN